MQTFKRLAVAVSVMTLVGASDARAQNGAVWGYGFIAPGIFLDSWAVATSYERDFFTPRAFETYRDVERMVEWGGGVEWKFQSVGIGAELHALHLADTPEYPGGILSVNGSYHWREARLGARAWVPFVTIGYSFGMDRNHGFNLGAGTNFWSRGNNGVRLEVRGTGLRSEGFPGLLEPYYDWAIAFRAGVNFGRRIF